MSGQQSCANCHVSTSGHAPDNDLPAQKSGLRLDQQGSRNAPSNEYLAFNTPFFFDGEGTPTGGFFWDGRANSLQEQAGTPFLRWEQFNTARSFADLGPGLTPDAAPLERVVTLGANLQVSQGIVLKADYQRFRENTDLNRTNLGLGWSF